MDREVNFKHRYWIFETYEYYPLGGLDDITFTTDSEEEAREYFHLTSKGDAILLFDSEERVYIKRKGLYI
ncbi:tail assembly protein [Bacillus phage SWEP1]|nr:tail assembly protein [Bacillus phage SWEP1]